MVVIVGWWSGNGYDLGIESVLGVRDGWKMRPLAGCRSGGVGSVNREARLPVMATDDSTLGIAAEWWEELREFRTTHRLKRVSVDGVGWEYIASGDGEEALLILPGGAMVGEAVFTWPSRAATGFSSRV